jgi:LacI family transcriptional regulator
MAELMESNSPPEYVFIANYYMHIGAAKFLAERRGGDGPEGAARIAHFDDMEITSLLGFSSLTIRQPMEDIGREAASLLLERIDETGIGVRSSSADTSPRIIRLATRLIDPRIDHINKSNN